MSITTRVSLGSLSAPFVLAPERYDPRRVQEIEGDSVSLSELASIENPTVSVKSLQLDTSYLVLDTGDSFEGVIRPRTEPGDRSIVKSSKKLVKEGDVIISRLRPYLRQVAYVDKGITECAQNILVSTEFFILRSRDAGESAAWLVPFLLSPNIQSILGRSQEGGHHPRFNKDTLGEIRVPIQLVNDRKNASRRTEGYIEAIRVGLTGLKEMTFGSFTDDD